MSEFLKKIKIEIFQYEKQREKMYILKSEQNLRELWDPQVKAGHQY